MTTTHFRNNEPLFVVIVRDAQANALLKSWAAENNGQSSQIQDNRLHIYDHHGLSTFMVTWTGGWKHVVIWDCWNKRHIDLQNS